MLGTLVNTGAIILGSMAGSFLKKGLNERYQNMLFDAMGLAAVGLGLHAVVKNLSVSVYPVLFIVSLALGGLLGTYWDLTGKFDNFVAKFSKSNLSQGLSTAIMLFCIGTLSILGPIESAINGNNTYLFTNATLDLVTSFVLASSYGIGIIFSAVVLFLWQGGIYLFAHQIAPSLTPEFMAEISTVGGFLILASGLGILKIKEIKTLNLLPALLIPGLWFGLIRFF